LIFIGKCSSDVMSVCSSDSMDTYNHSSLSSSFNSLPVTDKNDYRLDYIRAARTSESKNVSEYQVNIHCIKYLSCINIVI